MGERLKRKAIYLTTIAAMIAMTGGFVMATTITTLTSPPGQGGGFAQTGTPPAGVTTVGTLMVQAAGSASATVNSLASPSTLTAGASSASDSIFVNDIGSAGDFLQTITVTFTAGGAGAAASTEYELSINVAGSTTGPQLVFIETSSAFASPAVDTVTLEWDMGTGVGGITITSVSDLITQCPSVGNCA